MLPDSHGPRLLHLHSDSGLLSDQAPRSLHRGAALRRMPHRHRPRHRHDRLARRRDVLRPRAIIQGRQP